MSHARRFDRRITIGAPPNVDDLRLLNAAGFATLIDLGDEEEKLGPSLRREAQELGFAYVSVPIDRGTIDFEDVLCFYLAAFERGSSPIYAFSRRGRRPLAFLLLLECVLSERPVQTVFETARLFELELDEDPLLSRFLVDVRECPRMKEAVEMLRHLRPDLITSGSSAPLPAEE